MCCKCVFKHAKGFKNCYKGLVVDECINGDIHMFCDRCLTKHEDVTCDSNMDLSGLVKKINKDGGIIATRG